MIHLGTHKAEKNGVIRQYCAGRDIKKVFILTPDKFRFECDFDNTEYIGWDDIIMYKFFYRLLQEIDNRTLVVVNECLRTQNRNDLTYNCIRHFLNQTTHQLIFQQLPVIEDLQDFMILFDFDTRSRWKREKFSPDLIGECGVVVNPKDIRFVPFPVETSPKLKAQYQAEKRKLIDGIGLKDPHTIPRNLYLLSGKDKLRHIEEGRHYVGRNNRFKIDTLRTYKDDQYPNAYTVFEFCHNYIDFADFAAISGQTTFPVLTADLKVDQWYFERFTTWKKNLDEAYAAIQQ